MAKPTPVGTKGYTGNPNGRPVDKLKGLTSAEIRTASKMLKKVTVQAVQAMIECMDLAKTPEAKARAAKEVLQMSLTLDAHIVRRADAMNKLLQGVGREDAADIDGEDDLSARGKATVFDISFKG